MEKPPENQSGGPKPGPTAQQIAIKVAGDVAKLDGVDAVFIIVYSEKKNQMGVAIRGDNFPLDTMIAGAVQLFGTLRAEKMAQASEANKSRIVGPPGMKIIDGGKNDGGPK